MFKNHPPVHKFAYVILFAVYSCQKNKTKAILEMTDAELEAEIGHIEKQIKCMRANKKKV